MTDYETKFADKNFQYVITDAEKTEDNEVVVEGTLSRQGSKGKAFFEYTYGCDDEANDITFKKKSSKEITDIINDNDFEEDIMKKIRTTVVKKGKKLRDPWLEGTVNLTSKADDEEESEYEEEEEEEEEEEDKTPAKGIRRRRNSGASTKSNKSNKSNKSKKAKKSEDDMTPANRLTSLNLKVKSRQSQIKIAMAERDKAEGEYKKNAHRLNKYAKKQKLTKEIGDVMSSIVKLKALKTNWADYEYVDSEDEDGQPYEPGDEPEGHCLHDLANVLRSVADIVDSRNSNVEQLQKEIDEYTAQWLKARRDHTANQYYEMTGKMPTDMELVNMGV